MADSGGYQVASDDAASHDRAGWTYQLWRYSSRSLVTVSWMSCLLFGIYILVFYAGALVTGKAAQWNQVLAGLHSPSQPLATAGIGIHFAAGGVILALGFVQLLGTVRRRAPVVHRWLGRVYVASSLLAGLGGLIFILSKGTIGGRPMDIGFGLYGLLMVVAAVQTFRYARQRRTIQHRAWAMRLFALAIGSWLYRMEYGFWFLAAHKIGHTSHFTGAFDVVMAFFFYLPNLVIAELYLRSLPDREPGTALRIAASTAMVAATVFLLAATWFFTTKYWIPTILAGIR